VVGRENAPSWWSMPSFYQGNSSVALVGHSHHERIGHGVKLGGTVYLHKDTGQLSCQ
jgi:hypothetical protein